MWLVTLALFCGTFIGTLAGGLVGWWLLVRANAARRPLDQAVADVDLDGRIRRAAADWATAHGRPEAAPLLADKLRLLHRRQQRRGRWSR